MNPIDVKKLIKLDVQNVIQDKCFINLKPGTPLLSFPPNFAIFSVFSNTLRNIIIQVYFWFGLVRQLTSARPVEANVNKLKVFFTLLVQLVRPVTQTTLKHIRPQASLNYKLLSLP